MGGCGLVEVVSVQTLVVCWVTCGLRFWWIWWCGYVLWLPTVVVLVGLIWDTCGWLVWCDWWLWFVVLCLLFVLLVSWWIVCLF